MSIEKTNPVTSGEDVKVWKIHLLDIYKAKYGHEFKFFHCYKFAQNSPEFQSLFAPEGNSTKSFSGSDDANKKHRKGAGSLEKCPVGMKKAKLIKKEDEMADRMANKFGIHSSMTTGENSEMTKSPGLHDGVAGFLSIGRLGMLTWMIQSMSNLASAEMQQQYVDEIMKQQILKIHQEKANMESAIVVLTGRQHQNFLLRRFFLPCCQQLTQRPPVV